MKDNSYRVEKSTVSLKDSSFFKREKTTPSFLDNSTHSLKEKDRLRKRQKSVPDVKAKSSKRDKNAPSAVKDYTHRRDKSAPSMKKSSLKRDKTPPLKIDPQRRHRKKSPSNP